MNLHEEIKVLLDEMLPNIPPEVATIMADAAKKIADSGVAERAIKLGEAVPSFELPNALGNKVSSANLLKDGPLVLSFYRGAW